MDETPEFWAVRAEYDAMMSRKYHRRKEAMAEAERLCAEEDDKDHVALAKVLHRAYNIGDLSKMQLRKATRQYGSPRFADLWEATPFEDRRERAVVQETAGFTGETLTVQGAEWNWDGVDVDHLEFAVEYDEELGRNIPKWPDGSYEHARFNMLNARELNKVVNP